MSKTYVRKEATYEDVKSTASTFLVIGFLGIIGVILVALDIIPLTMETYSKVLMMTVMGILFVIFLIIGIIYQRRLRSLKTEITEETNLTQSIFDWFLEHYSSQAIDSQIVEQPEEEEALYFARYEIMTEALNAQYPQLEESYMDHLIEELYGKLFTTTS